MYLISYFINDGCTTEVNYHIVPAKNSIVFKEHSYKLIMYRLQSAFHSGRTVCLTLRLLMSYIYMERIFLMFLDHTQRRTTVGMTPLDE